jgi:hypothetical protein
MLRLLSGSRVEIPLLETSDSIDRGAGGIRRDPEVRPGYVARRGPTFPCGRFKGAVLGSLMAFMFILPSAHAAQIGARDTHAVQTAVQDTTRPALPRTDSPTWANRAQFREILAFMKRRVDSEVTPLARIVTGNGRAKEILPTKSSGHETIVLELSGLGPKRMWTAWGLAPTSAGQDRDGMTAKQNAHHYADIDDYTFMIRKKGATDFTVIGQVPGIDPVAKVARLVAPVPIFVAFDGPGEYEIVFNPFPSGLTEQQIRDRLGYLCWKDGGTTTTGVAFPPHPNNKHDDPVSPHGFPMGRMIVVKYDGT